MPYSKTFVDFPLSADTEAKSPTTAPKSPHDFTSSSQRYRLPQLKILCCNRLVTIPWTFWALCFFCAFMHFVLSTQMAFLPPPPCKSLSSPKPSQMSSLSWGWHDSHSSLANGATRPVPTLPQLCSDQRFSTRVILQPQGTFGNI